MTARYAALALPLLLNACAAALIPVAVTGVAAHHRMKARHGDPQPPQPTPAGSEPVDLSRLAPVPGDPAKMQPGQAYVGAMPTPVPSPASAGAGGSAPPAPIGPEGADRPAQASPPATASGWTDLLRFVAGHFSERAEHGVLLARGATLAEPRWVPCADKPVAIMADVDAAAEADGSLARPAASVLDALETLGVTVVYTTKRSGRDLLAMPAMLRAAHLHAPVPGTTLLTVAAGQEPAVRAAAGARYCVVAIAGPRAEDFPNGATPASAAGPWGAGWFLIPGR